MATRRQGSSGELGSASARVVRTLERESATWATLGVAMALSAALGLWLTRGITFHEDDLLYYVANRGFNFRDLIGPHNGQLIFLVRLTYALGLKLFGAHYLEFRVIEVACVLLTSGLFFILAKDAIGPAAALAPAVLLLFFGSAYSDTIDTDGIPHMYVLVLGLAALVALRRRRVWADLLAVALLTGAIASHTNGLVFVVIAGVLILADRTRRSRSWVFAVPLALWLAWFFAPKLHTTPFSTATGFKASSLLLLPSYVVDSAAAVLSAITGLGYDFSNPGSLTIYSPIGYVLAAGLVLALVLALRRQPVPVGVWAVLAGLLFYWLLSGVVSTSGQARNPGQNRYVFTAAVLIILVTVQALRGARPSPPVLIVLYAATIVAIVGNLASARVGADRLRAEAPLEKATLGAVQIAAGHEHDSYAPTGDLQTFFLIKLLHGVGPYLQAVRRNGSFAYTAAQIERQSEHVREVVDLNLFSGERVSLEPLSSPPPGGRCLTVANHPQPLEVTVRPPGLAIRSPVSQPAKLRRFGPLAAPSAGQLIPGRFQALAIVADASTVPWRLSLRHPDGVKLCPLRSG